MPAAAPQLIPTDPDQWMAQQQKSTPPATAAGSTLTDPDAWMAQQREQPGPVSRGFSGIIGAVNPIPAIEQWWNKTVNARKDNDAMMDAMVTGLKVRERTRHGGTPATPEEQAIIDKGSNALARQDAQTAQPPFVPGETRPIIQAGHEAYQGNLAGAGGTLIGGYGAPILIGATLGAGADLLEQEQAVRPAGTPGLAPGTTVRTTIPVEPTPSASAAGGGGAGTGLAKDVVGIISPRAGHVISVATKVGNIIQRIKGETPGTRTIEFQVQPRGAPAYENITVNPRVTPEFTPTPAQSLPSGRTVGSPQHGAQVSAESYFRPTPAGDVVEVPPTAPAAPVPAAAAAPTVSVQPPVQPPVQAPPPVPAPTPAPAPAPEPSPTVPVQPPAGPPTPEEMAAAFNPEKAAFEAAKAKQAAAASTVRKTAGDAWADEMADRLYQGGQGISPQEAQMLSMDQLDQLAKAGGPGKSPLSLASRRSPETILRMRQRLWDRWVAGRPSYYPPPGYQPFKAQ